MGSTMTLVSLNFNASSSSVEVTASNTDGFQVACDNLSKLLLLAYNNDTGVASVSVLAGGAPYIGIGVGNLTTSIAGKEYRVFGPFEGTRFKSSNATVVINSTSTASTNVTFRAYLLP
jgi:hypothetical protein